MRSVAQRTTPASEYASPLARPPRRPESPNASSNRPAEFPARDGSVNLGASPARGSPRVGVGRQPRTNKRQVSSAGGRASELVDDGRHQQAAHILVDTRRLPKTRASTRRWYGTPLSSPSPPPIRVPMSIRIVLRSSSMTCVWTILTLPRRLLGRDCSTPYTFSQTRTGTVCSPETPRPTTPPPPSSPPA